MLRAIDKSNEAEAVDILARGFPRRTRAFWQASLARLHAYGGNATAGVPVGYLLVQGDAPVGVVLTPARLRSDPDGKQRRAINISSWYIDPDHRWRAPMMLRSITQDSGATFTDLSPIAAVQKILVVLGFKPITGGESMVALPKAALDVRSGARVLELEAVPEHGISVETRRLVEQHALLGCIGLALEAEGRWLPLLFKPCARRRLAGARLVFCEDNALLKRWIGPVARSLLRRGKLFLILDLEPNQTSSGGYDRPGFAIKYAKNGNFTNRTDYAGTELCLFDL